MITFEVCQRKCAYVGLACMHLEKGFQVILFHHILMYLEYGHCSEEYLKIALKNAITGA